MIIRPLKTEKVLPSSQSLFELLDKSIAELKEKSIVAITSKVVSLCEGQAVPVKEADKEELIQKEADYYLPSSYSQYEYHFSIKHKTLIAAAGIDESNGNGHFILWPKDPQKTANAVRKHLKNRFKLDEVGVIITDSTVMPFRWGTIGIFIAHSGFVAVNNYVGQPDLFGRPFEVSRAGVALGLAAAATVAMGEGTEQTPLAIIEDVSFVSFQSRDPSEEELKMTSISREDDLFAPFINSVKWRKGGGGE